MLTYRSKAEAIADRDIQRRLMQALHATYTALRRDECGGWRINGTRGHVYTWGGDGGWLLFVASGSARRWTADKKRLAFCLVTQNDDDEGVVRMFGPPTPEQAAVLRQVLGIRRRVTYSAEVLAAKREHALALDRSRGPTETGAQPEIRPMSAGD